MKLRSLLILISLLLSVVVITLAGQTLYAEWQRADRASEGREAIQRLQQVLGVAEMASRERGPVVALFGAGAAEEPPVRARLATARQRTDRVFADLLRDLASAGERRHGLYQDIDRARQSLMEARTVVDQVTARPLEQRNAAALREAIGRMFAVIEDLASPTTDLMNEAQAAYPSTTDLLIGARHAADLREYAGQVGSHLTVAVARPQPLPPEEVVAIEELRGRIAQLQDLLTRRIARARDRPAVQQALADMMRHYFEHAVPFTQDVERDGGHGGHYTIDSVTFVARYVPDMDSILHLRDVELAEALQDALAGEQQARQRLVLVALSCLLVLLALGAMLATIQRRILRPLRGTVDLLSSLAQGDFDREIPQPRHDDELAAVVNAIRVLREYGLARRDLEEERQSLIEQLRDQSNTDVLTGLTNRRGFLAQSAHLLPSVQRHRDQMAVLLFDIDHFKQVNDSQGHAAGDVVLVAIADLCREICRAADVVARYGGEEFVILMPNTTLEGAAIHAERLRAGIAGMQIAQPDGAVITVTASFGVAECLPRDAGLTDAIKRADNLLYEAKRQGRNRVRFRS